MRALESHGIPTVYGDSPVAATAGQTIRAFPDTEICELLSGGLLLDAVAAGVLCERGFAAQIGLAQMRPPEHLDRLGAFAAEEHFNPDFGGADKCFLTLTIPGLGGRPDFSVMDLLPTARTISCIVDPDACRQHVCMYAFENDLGGRIVVQAFDLGTAFGTAYCHPHRRRQLQRAVAWAAKGRAPVLVRGNGAFPLAFRKDCGSTTVLGFFNLNLDPWPDLVFDIAATGPVSAIASLSAAGRWGLADDVSAQFADGRLCVAAPTPVHFSDPLFLRLHWR